MTDRPLCPTCAGFGHPALTDEERERLDAEARIDTARIVALLDEVLGETDD